MALFDRITDFTHSFNEGSIPASIKLSERFKNFLAFDTETTGLDVRSTDRPYLITSFDGVEDRVWRFRVQLKNGRVVPNKAVIADFEEYASQYEWFVGFNVGFDVHAISWYSDFFKDKHDRCLDVQIMSWTLDNQQDEASRKGSRGLKRQAYKVCRIDDEDEEALHDITRKARALAKKKKLLYPGTRNLAETYWLPRALWEKFPEEVPAQWETVDEEYGVRDAVRTAALFKVYSERLDKKGWWSPYLERQALLAPFYDIERRGLRVLPEKLDAFIEDARGRAQRSASICSKIVKSRIPKEEFAFNIDSPMDMRIVMYDVLGFTPRKLTGKTRAPSTDAEAVLACLQEVSIEDPEFIPTETRKEAPRIPLPGFRQQFEFLTAYQLYKKFSGAESKAQGYVASLFDNRLNPSYNLGSTRTTRLSSENPNGQNISKGKKNEDGVKEASLRQIFGPDTDEIWYSVDLDQNQLRIYAYDSEETKLIEAFERGDDIHNYVACEMFDTDSPDAEQRRLAKNVNFGLIFGAGKTKIDSLAGEGSFDLFKQLFPDLARYMSRCMNEVERTGGVTLPNGLFLRVETGLSYKGANYRVQGIEGLQVGKAVRDIFDYFQGIQGNAYIVSCIHDDITFGIKRSVNPTIRRSIVSRAADLFRDAGLTYGVKAGIKVEWTQTTLDEMKPMKLALQV